MAREKAVFIRCEGADMTYVSVTSNVPKLLEKVARMCPLEVELVAEVEGSRGAVSAVQRALNGRRQHDQWFDGQVTREEAEGLMAEGERDASAPSGAEVTAWRYRVSTLVGEVAYLDDDDAARDAWRAADSALRDMRPRLVAEAHVEHHDRLRTELDAAAVSRRSG